jgi:hypothetical protein
MMRNRSSDFILWEGSSFTPASGNATSRILPINRASASLRTDIAMKLLLSARSARVRKCAPNAAPAIWAAIRCCAECHSECAAGEKSSTPVSAATPARRQLTI